MLQSWFLLERALWAGHRPAGIKDLFAKIHFSSRIPASPLKNLSFKLKSACLFCSVVVCNFIIYPVVRRKLFWRHWLGGQLIYMWTVATCCLQSDLVSPSLTWKYTNDNNRSYYDVPLCSLRGTWFPKLKVTQQKSLFLKWGQSLDEYKAVLRCHGEK